MPRAKQRTPQLREHVLHVAIALLRVTGCGFTALRIVGVDTRCRCVQLFAQAARARGLLQGFRRRAPTTTRSPSRSSLQVF